MEVSRGSFSTGNQHLSISGFLYDELRLLSRLAILIVGVGFNSAVKTLKVFLNVINFVLNLVKWVLSDQSRIQGWINYLLNRLRIVLGLHFIDRFVLFDFLDSFETLFRGRRRALF